MSFGQPESGKTTASSAGYVYTFSLLCVRIPQEILYIIAYYFSTHAGDLKYIWQDVQKIIDTPHIHNHKDARCKEMYTPDRIKEEHPTYNTMSCEHLCGRPGSKKLCALSKKKHYHFYVHRMVKRRNSYIEYCYVNNRRPCIGTKT